jgi:hypothetical protein
MANPLSTGAARNRAQPGDTITIYDDKSKRSWTVLRSAREFIFDLCDAYNAQLSDELRQRGQEWFVTPQGTIALGTTAGYDAALHKRSMRTLRSIDAAELDRAA